ncbi:MAG: chorismate mutase [Chlorobium sp.]|jgi:chorismate mutase|uniref:chorismate mutase n=1 Tax=Chlorobium sp. TaxID=1095 RepID=UPI001E186861|nr:chorismate mutase [Chlorobium sp.]MBN1279037.1 chorismate mutase [Chlorobiaceae bacterium]MCF8216316.1 chorismate mutase [Chlorobium sp.]MCF8271218.1 chorismate mutase [Chlorobium sp.]MCF8287592.1 chorismate mutase [Chlorobium sp.]MCF8291131.1 chorismate mutase [Chlorobium sp.]
MPESPLSNTGHWQELEKWRKKIDNIDSHLAALLCERLQCARNISILKARIGEQVLQPEREKEVLSNVISQADSQQKVNALERIYRSILEESRLFQHEQNCERHQNRD